MRYPRANRLAPAVAATALPLLLAACGQAPPAPARPLAGSTPSPRAASPSARALPASASASATASKGSGDFPSPEPIPTHPVPAASRVPMPRHVDQQSASAVSRAVAHIMSVMDTDDDTSPWQAEVRATRYFTPSYAKLIKGTPPVAAPGARWNLWTRHHVRTRVKLTQSHQDPMPDSSVYAHRVWTAVITPVGKKDGWHGKARTTVYFFTMTRSSPTAYWRVSTVTT